MVNKSSSPATLDEEIATEARKLCKVGYELFDQGDIKTALRRFYSAWTMLPKPQTDYEEAGWILTALGDAYLAKGEYENAKEALLSALHCPKTLGNPIIHLRLGECLQELNQVAEANEQFQLVIDNGGEELFAKEKPKYFELFNQSVHG